MRKILSLVLIAVFAATLGVAFCAEEKKGVVRTEIETKDGFTLVGDFYPTKVKGKKMPLVIILHSFNGKSSDWGNLPKNIASGGYNVFALDLRGHGRSVYTTNLIYRSKDYFTDKAWARLPSDILEAIDFMKETYSKVDYDKIMFIGADIGANAAVLAGDKMKIKPVKMVLITPAQEFKTLYIPIVISNYSNTPMLLLASSSDKYFAKQANTLSKFIQSQQTVKLYNQGSSGTVFLKQNPGAYRDIYNFLYN